MASREIGSVWIRVAPDASNFRRDAQREIDRQPDIEADAEVSLDQSQYEREKRKAEKNLNRRPIGVDAEVDIESTLRGLDQQMRQITEMAQAARDTRAEVDRMSQTLSRMGENISSLELGVDEASFRRMQERVEALEAELALSTGDAEASLEQFRQVAEAQDVSVGLEANPDLASFAGAHAQMRAATPAIPVQTRLDQGSVAATVAGLHALGAQRVRVPIGLSGLARAEAAIVALSRDRVIRLRASLLGRGWRGLRGGLRSMAGLGDMDQIVYAFEDVVTRMDVVGSQVATLGTVIGSAVNVGVHALGGLITTAADATRALGLLAAAPTAILAGWAGFQVHNTIWSGFRDALEGYDDALEKLPPNAQRAVGAIQDLSAQVNDSVQNGFWGEMTDEITRFAETVAPVLEKGMHRTAEIYADGMSGMLDLAQGWAESGQLGAAFSNINRMFEGVANGAVDAFDAFMAVGMRASGLFPRLGHTIEQAFSGLNQWTQWASETGRIDRWIIGAIDTVQQFGRALSATGGMVDGLVQAFRNAGIGGLPAFVDGLEAARGVMQSSEWQFRMGNIFEGMAIGARRTWEGVERLAGALYDAHQWARDLSVVIGDIAFVGLGRFADVLENPIFQRGTMDLFEGFRDSLVLLEPAFDSAGNVMGEFGSLTGEIMREMAPGVNTLMGVFSDLATKLGPLLVEAVGPLTDFIDNIGHTLRWNVNNLIIPAVGGLLEIFNALPQGIQRFLALGAVMSRWLPALGNSFRRLTGRVGANAQAFGSASRITSRAYNDMLTSGRRYNRFTQGSLHTMQQATRQHRRTGQIIQAQVRPHRNLAGAVGLSAEQTTRYNRALDRTSQGYRNGVAAGRNFVRSFSPILGAYSRMRVEGGRAMDGIRGGFNRADRAAGRFATNTVGHFARVERSLVRAESSMRRMRATASTMRVDYMGGATFAGDGGRGVRNLSAVQRAWGRLQATASTAAASVARSASRMGGAVSRSVSTIRGGFSGMWSGMAGSAVSAWSRVRDATTRGASRVVGVVRDIPERTRTAMLGIGSGMNRAWDRMSDGARNATARTVGIIRGGFQAVPGIVRTAGAAASVAWTGAVTTMGAATRGLGSLIRGMFSLMGGLPGVALVGIITAIGTIRGQAAEAEASIDQMFEAMKAGDNQALRDSIFSELEDRLIEITDAGGSARTMLDDLATGGDVQVWQDRADALGEFINNFGHMDWDQMVKDGTLTAEGLAQAEANAGAFGMTLGEANDLSHSFWYGLSADVEGTAGTIQLAEDKMASYTDSVKEAKDVSVLTGGELRKVAQEMANNGEQFHQASDGAQRFAETVLAVGDSSQSADSRISSMRESLMMLNEDYSDTASIAIESWDRQQESMRTAGEIAETSGKLIGDATDGMSHDVEDMSQRQVLALQMASSIQDQAMAASVSAYDRARNAGEDHATAVEAGAEAYDGVMGKIQKFGEEAGLSGKEIETLTAEVNRLGDEADVELVLDMQNLAQNEIEMAYDGLRQVNEMGAKIDSAEWMAFIAANPDQAFVAVEDAERALFNFKAQEYIADLGADKAGAVEAIAEAKGLGDLWEQGEFEAVMTVITDMDDAETAYEALMEWDSEWVEANLGAKDEAMPKIEALMEDLESYDRTWTADLDEEGAGSVRQVMVDIREILEEFAKEHGIHISSNSDTVKAAVEGLNRELDKTENPRAGEVDIVTQPSHDRLGMLYGDLGQIDESRTTAEVDSNTDPAHNKLEFLYGNLGEVDRSKTTAEIDANDGASPKAQGAVTALGMIDTSWVAQLFANDGVSSTADGARTSAEGVEGPWWAQLFTAGVSSFLGDTSSAKAGVEGIPGSAESNLFSTGDLLGDAMATRDSVLEIPPTRSTTFSFLGNLLAQVRLARDAIAVVPDTVLVRLMAAGNIVSQAQVARAAVAGIPSKHVTLMASGNIVSQAQVATVSVANIPSKHVTLMASGNIAQMAATAVSAVSMVRSKRITLSATGNATPFTQRAISTIRSFRSKRVTLTATGNAISFAMRARSAMLNVPSVVRSIRVTSNAWSASRSAQWAINSVRGKTVTITTRRRTIGAHADGALYSGGVQQFADGGFKENHRAMIASPSPDLRVWAEPETGGEAYIPLAASKRARSTAIWEETGKRLGVFEDGGIVGGQSGPQAPDGPTFNITNNYPQSESTSRTVQRSMALLGTGG